MEERINDVDYKHQLKTARFMIDNFNKEIKYLSSMCYIDYNGLFYLKSDSTKMERFGKIIKDDSTFEDLFKGSLYDTGALHEFKKDYRFSTSNIYSAENKIIIGQTEKSKSPDAKFEFNIVSTSDDVIIEDTRNNIRSSFYNKFFDVLEKENLDPIDLDRLDYIEITEEMIENLTQNSMICVIEDRFGEHLHAYITKELFPNINHATSISYIGLKTKGDNDDKRAYFIFKEYDEVAEVIIFTLIAAYQSV